MGVAIRLANGTKIIDQMEKISTSDKLAFEIKCIFRKERISEEDILKANDLIRSWKIKNPNWRNNKFQSKN